MLERNGPLIVLQYRLALGRKPPQDLHVANLGDNLPHIRVQLHLALLNQLHETGRGEELGQGSPVGEGIAIEIRRVCGKVNAASGARIDDAYGVEIVSDIQGRAELG